MASPASRVHEVLLTFLAGIFGAYISRRQLGELTGPNAVYRLNEQNVHQPDLAFVFADRLGQAGEVFFEVFFDGAPDLAVEIASSSSRQYDYVEKLVNCGRFGVQEYWLVDPILQSVSLDGNVIGQLVAIPAQGGVLHSRLLPGFWLRIAWVFLPAGAARPSELAIAEELGLPERLGD